MGEVSGTNYAYLSTTAQKKSRYPVGLGFGGDNDYDQFRIWYDPLDTSKCYANHEDLTFQMGVLGELSNELNIVNMEIWGLGDKDAMEYQEKQLGYEEVRQMNRRKIDKA